MTSAAQKIVDLVIKYESCDNDEDYDSVDDLHDKIMNTLKCLEFRESLRAMYNGIDTTYREYDLEDPIIVGTVEYFIKSAGREICINTKNEIMIDENGDEII